MSLYKVLYIEDDPNNRLVFERIMQKIREARAIEVHLAETAEEGIAIARQIAKGLNLIFLDINLPGMSGFDAIKILREDPALRKVPVVAITASTNYDRSAYLDVGFVDLVLKPVTVARMMACCNRYGVY
jgi:CheY-like chemotaxis protein